MKDISKFEKAFRLSADLGVQQDIVKYLEALFNKSLKELLQYNAGEVEDRNIKIGELRILKKVVEVLSPDDGLVYSVASN